MVGGRDGSGLGDCWTAFGDDTVEGIIRITCLTPPTHLQHRQSLQHRRRRLHCLLQGAYGCVETPFGYAGKTDCLEFKAPVTTDDESRRRFNETRQSSVIVKQKEKNREQYQCQARRLRQPILQVPTHVHLQHRQQETGHVLQQNTPFQHQPAIFNVQQEIRSDQKDEREKSTTSQNKRRENERGW